MIGILDKVDESDLQNATNCQGVCEARASNARTVFVKKMPSRRKSGLQLHSNEAACMRMIELGDGKESLFTLPNEKRPPSRSKSEWRSCHGVTERSNQGFAVCHALLAMPSPVASPGLLSLAHV